MPRHADLAVWISGFSQAHQLLVAGLVEAFVTLRQEPTALVERVSLAAPVTERVVLYPATTLIESGVREACTHETGPRLGPRREASR